MNPSPVPPTSTSPAAFDGNDIFRRLIDSVRDYAIFMLDAEGHIASWNTGAQRIKGYAAGEIIGQHFSIFYPPEAMASGWPEEELRLARVNGRMEDEGWRIRKDGSRFWANVVISPLWGADGELIGFSKVTRDLTERRRMQELEIEGRRLHQFIAMLSHELRNPLAPIANAARVLQQAETPSEITWCAELIERQVGHLKRLVDDLLDVSRINSGKIRLRTAPVELNTLLQLALDAVRAQVDGYRHRLDVRLAPQPVMVNGDTTRLTQVVANLVSNAAKYTPPGGHIVISTEHGPSVAVLQVEDNGIGMSEALMQHAFDPFVQGDRALDRSEGGLGIGLTLVRNIVEMHGGTVRVVSGGPGKGSRFTVTLPLTTAGAPGRTEPSVQVTRRSSGKILVVDDNKDSAESLAELLRIWGHEVMLAHDGAQALRKATAEPPKTILLDLGLPGMDGYEVARRLREVPALRGTRLIAMTGYGQASDKRATAEAGFEAHLVKPVDFDELEKLI